MELSSIYLVVGVAILIGIAVLGLILYEKIEVRH